MSSNAITAAGASLPVSVLTGFLGSGKTTLLAQLLQRPALARTAVIINELGEVGLDHELVRRVAALIRPNRKAPDRHLGKCSVRYMAAEIGDGPSVGAGGRFPPRRRDQGLCRLARLGGDPVVVQKVGEEPIHHPASKLQTLVWYLDGRHSPLPLRYVLCRFR